MGLSGEGTAEQWQGREALGRRVGLREQDMLEEWEHEGEEAHQDGEG